MTAEQDWKKNRSAILRGCDPEIRKVLSELNGNGLFTEESCAGHKGSKVEKTGRIFFYSRYAKHGSIMAILKKHGLTGIRKVPSYSRGFMCYEFDPVSKGKSQTDRRVWG